MTERLSFIKSRINKKGVAAYYAWYDPKAEYLIETSDATEDVLWMIAEIERLRVENNDLRSPRFSDLMERQFRRAISRTGKAGRKAVKKIRRGPPSR